MYGLKKTKGLNERAGHARVPASAAVAVAALVLLSALPSAARGQAGGVVVIAGKVSMQDFHFVMRSTLGAGRGQTVRFNVINPVFADGSVRLAGVHVKVFSGADGSLLRSHEISDPPAGLHSFDVNRDELPVAGEDGTGRVQLLVEVSLLVRSARRGQAAEPEAGLFPTSFELTDNETGQTILIGMLLPAIQKVR